MIRLNIDPEFRDKIPPLTGEEFKQLEENILSDGEVYEPIAVWNGTIVDGHNRWDIIQKHPEIPFRTKEMDFPDKWAAFEWMYKKQLGRRNLTEEQKTYVIGKMYEARKHTQGGDHGNQYTKVANGQNVHLPNRRETRDGTAGQIGKEFGIDGRTVRRAEKFANGVEALRSVSPVAAEKILRGEVSISQTAVSELAGKKESEVKAIAKAIERGENLKATTFPSGNKHEKVEEYKPLINHDRESPAVEYTLDDLMEEMRAINDDFLGKYKRILNIHKALISENAAEVSTVFVELMNEFEKLEDF